MSVIDVHYDKYPTARRPYNGYLGSSISYHSPLPDTLRLHPAIHWDESADDTWPYRKRSSALASLPQQEYETDRRSNVHALRHVPVQNSCLPVLYSD